MSTKEKIEKVKAKLRKISIGAMTALTLTTGGLNASAQNNATGKHVNNGQLMVNASRDR